MGYLENQSRDLKPADGQIYVRGCWYKVSSNKVWRWSGALGEWFRSTQCIDEIMKGDKH